MKDKSSKQPLIVCGVRFVPHKPTQTVGVIFRTLDRPTQPLDQAKTSQGYALQPQALRELAEHLLGYADYLEGKGEAPEPLKFH